MVRSGRSVQADNLFCRKWLIATGEERHVAVDVANEHYILRKLGNSGTETLQMNKQMYGNKNKTSFCIFNWHRRFTKKVHVFNFAFVLTVTGRLSLAKYLPSAKRLYHLT